MIAALAEIASLFLSDKFLNIINVIFSLFNDSSVNKVYLICKIIKHGSCRVYLYYEYISYLDDKVRRLLFIFRKYLP